MSDSHISKSEITGDLSFARRIILFQNAIRCSTLSLLRSGTISLAERDLFCGLETMKTLADTTLELAMIERLSTEKRKINAETEKIKEETELAREERAKIKAGLVETKK